VTRHLPQPPRPHAAPARGYQPQWVDGREVGVGNRECASRYRAIKDYLTQNTNVHFMPTVLDLGAYTGYFCRRLHDDLGAQCTAVDNNPSLEESEGVTVIPRLLNPAGVRELGHFDVTLCLSVLHHHANWYDFLAALVESADVVFIETAHPQERMNNQYRPYVIGAHQEMQKIGKVIAETPPLYDSKYKRPLWVVDRRRVATREEQCGAVETALRGIIAGNGTVPKEGGEAQFALDIHTAGPTADAIISILGYTGWSLTYDPTVVANRLTEVMAQPLAPVDHGALNPPERFE
jgi:hypothetical protein